MFYYILAPHIKKLEPYYISGLSHSVSEVIMYFNFLIFLENEIQNLHKVRRIFVYQKMWKKA